MSAATAPAQIAITPRDVEAAYLKARAREKAPQGHLDAQFRLRVGRYMAAFHQDRAQMAGRQAQEHDCMLAASLSKDHAFFASWRDLPEAELEHRASALAAPQFSAPTPEDVVQNALRSAEAAGVRLTLSGTAFHAVPAARLDERLRQTLAAHHDAVVVELARRADVWIPQNLGEKT